MACSVCIRLGNHTFSSIFALKFYQPLPLFWHSESSSWHAGSEDLSQEDIHFTKVFQLWRPRIADRSRSDRTNHQQNVHELDGRDQSSCVADGNLTLLSQSSHTGLTAIIHRQFDGARPVERCFQHEFCQM